MVAEPHAIHVQRAKYISYYHFVKLAVDDDGLTNVVFEENTALTVTFCESTDTW